jgi:hypothetical protein
MRVMVAGMLAADPHQGGATWAVLQYVHGFERLGHEVLAVDPVDALSPDVVGYFESLGLDHGALLVEATHETAGVGYDDLASFDAELLVNISGRLRDPGLFDPVPTRLFLDLDPVFVQIWHAQGVDVGMDGHTHFATVGQGLSGSVIPLDRDWIPTRPPVVLEDWSFADELVHDAFTTVGHWRSYGSVEWEGSRYGQRAHAVRRLIELPQLSREQLLPALAVHSDERDDLRLLAEHGWELLDPAELAPTPDTYRDFVRGSKGEIGLAKAGYVDARCGWFSDRSACYLAAGRPVVAQDTGFGDYLPTGEGLIAFATATEGARALERVAAHYDQHREAARAIAEQCLDSDLVLTDLLGAVT